MQKHRWTAAVIAFALALAGCGQPGAETAETGETPQALETYKPGVEPGGGGGGPIAPVAPGGGATREECYSQYLGCLEYCASIVPPRPPFLVLYFECTIGCTAIYTLCRGGS